MNKKRNLLWLANQGLIWVFLILIFLFFLFPVFWLVTSALKREVYVFAFPPKWIFEPTLQYFRTLLTSREVNVLLPLRNSIIISVTTTAVTIVIGSLCAYSLARFRFKIGVLFGYGLLIGQMVPPVAFIVPIFIVYQKLGLIDNYGGLIAVYATFALPFATWMMRSFFEELPEELDDAARIDGCSWFGAFWRIALPLVAPGLAATAILLLIFCWNEFMFAVVLTRSETRTLTVLGASFFTERAERWGLIAANGVLMFIPMFAFALLVQKHIIRGLTLGAVKG